MNMKGPSPLGNHLAAVTVLAPIAWGTTYVTVTQFLPPDRPLFVAAMRVAPAGAIILAVATARSGWTRPTGIDLRRLAVLGLCNFGLFFPLLITAVYRLPGGVAAAVGGLQPLLVACLTWIITGHRPRTATIAIGCVAIIGVAMVVVHPGAHFDLLGVAAAVGANVSFSLGVVLTKQFPTPPDRLAATGWQLVMSAAVLLPLALFVEGAPPHLDGRNIAGFGYLSMIATAGAFVVWFNGIRRLPASTPPLLGLAAPITGVIMGWIVLGQSLNGVQLFGFAVTVAAIAYGASTAGQIGFERSTPRPSSAAMCSSV